MHNKVEAKFEILGCTSELSNKIFHWYKGIVYKKDSGQVLFLLVGRQWIKYPFLL